MTGQLVSVILPVYKQAEQIAAIVSGHIDALARTSLEHEVLLVPNGGLSADAEACAALAAARPVVRSLPPLEQGWGRAVRHGLAAARGDLLCYTNAARTTPEDLVLMILYAAAHPGTVVKANRKIRERVSRRVGSLLYNLECRTLFDLSCWDINGTPKVFPRACDRLLGLTRDDDMIDAEFAATCREAGYPMLEVPIFSYRRYGGASTTGWRSALRMYWGAFTLWQAHR